MYRYRCEQCRTTSPAAHSRHELNRHRSSHRDLFHGGHIPDGEHVIASQRTSLLDLPREQRIAAAVLVVALVVACLIRF
ncbi:hypothetical protein ACH5AL_24480 [Actinacidiphila glaucinigra]|uniref:hypothetical protein n=1 Tax=Actinacidiphila glaucinigra TaxID=235986 RepID=UPI003788FA8A